MQKLIKRLSKGFPYPHLRNLRTNPEVVQKQAVDASLDMKAASKLLDEAAHIIVGLTCDITTFGHREAALQWTLKYQKK